MFHDFCHAGEVSLLPVHIDRGDVKFGRLHSLQLMGHHWWFHLRTNLDFSHQKVLTFPVWHGAPTDYLRKLWSWCIKGLPRKAPTDLLWPKKHNVSNRPPLVQKCHVTSTVPNLLLRCLNAIQCSRSRTWYLGLNSVATRYKGEGWDFFRIEIWDFVLLNI